SAGARESQAEDQDEIQDPEKEEEDSIPLTTRARRARPTRTEVLAAAGRTVPDVVASPLAVLFCGINPGLYSGAVGHHFARPGNRFWKTLHLAGFTERVLSPFEEQVLLDHGLGITNLVERATGTADEISPE